MNLEDEGKGRDMAILKKKKTAPQEKRVLTAEGWLRRIRYTITPEIPQPKPRTAPEKKTSRPRGRPKKK